MPELIARDQEEIDQKEREAAEAQQKEAEKAEKAAASANKAKDAAEAEMAAKPAETWPRSTSELCAINQLGVDKKVAKAAGFRDAGLFRLYRAALDNRTASVSAPAGVTVEAGALQTPTFLKKYPAHVRCTKLPLNKPPVKLLMCSFLVESTLI